MSYRTAAVPARPQRRVLVVGALLTALTALLTLVVAPLGAPAVAAGRAAFHPTRLTHVGDARQVVVVTSSRWSSTHARLRAYGKRKDGWHRVFGPMDARIGYSGFARFGARKQGTGTTPAGTFTLLRAFGSAADPGTDLPYRRFDRNDWWPYDPRDPATYNVAQFHGRSDATTWRTSWAERLWHFRDQYRYAVVLDYNLPDGIYRSGPQRFATQTANTSAGGGIFLHVNGRGATAGCVSVSRSPMRAIVRWLDPDRHPVVVMAPKKAIGKA